MADTDAPSTIGTDVTVQRPMAKESLALRHRDNLYVDVTDNGVNGDADLPLNEQQDFNQFANGSEHRPYPSMSMVQKQLL